MVSQRHQRLSRRRDGNGLQFAKDVQFRNPGMNDLAHPLIHRIGTSDRAANHGQFIGMLVTSQVTKRRVDVHMVAIDDFENVLAGRRILR